MDTGGRMPKQTESMQARGSTSGNSWTFCDVLDFEYLLQTDAEASSTEAVARDRSIYLEKVVPGLGDGGADPSLPRRIVFLRWLEARREAFNEGEVLPGRLIGEAFPWIRHALIVMGVLLGSGLAATCLHYDGRQPVNVAAFLGVLVFPQMLLSSLAVILFLVRLPTRDPAEGAWSRFLRPLIGRGIRWFHRHTFLERPAGERRRLLGFIGYWSGRQRLFGSVAFWPVMVMFQAFGVALNVGVIGSTLALVLFSDRAFGWQSAVRFEPESVFVLVRALALPWSWAFPEGGAFPNLAEVAGSRIILKDGISALQTGSLVAWWPFLTLSAVAYGLVPRIVLLAASAVKERLNLARLEFNYVECDRLFERMTLPSLSMAAVGKGKSGKPDHSGRGSIPGQSADCGSQGSCLVLVPVDFSGRINDQRLGRILQERFQWAIGRRAEFRRGVGVDRRELVEPVGSELPDGGAKVVILHEAWRPPIAEFLALVRQGRQVWGPTARIIIGLFGKQMSGGEWAGVKEMDFTVWQQVVNAMGDPYLRVEKLLPDA